MKVGIKILFNYCFFDVCGICDMVFVFRKVGIMIV